MRLFFFLFLFSIFSQAQISFLINSSSEYNDNPFRDSVGNASYVNSTSFLFDFSVSKVSLNYMGSYNYYQKFADRNFYWHRLSFSIQDSLNVLSLNYSQRLNKNDYSLFDYSDFFLNAEKRFSLNMFQLRSSATGKFTIYKNLSEYNNFSFFANLSGYKFFDSKTTLILGLELNYKYYLQKTIANNISVNPYVFQGNFKIRVAQSIFEKTGISISNEYRKILSGNGKDIFNIATNYADETDLFDDPFSLNGNRFGIMITQILTNNLSLQINYNYETKNFPAQGIYLEDNTYRTSENKNDESSIISVSLKKELYSDNFLLNTEILFEYQNNISNSFFYNYSSKSLALNFTFLF